MQPHAEYPNSHGGARHTPHTLHPKPYTPHLQGGISRTWIPLVWLFGCVRARPYNPEPMTSKPSIGQGDRHPHSGLQRERRESLRVGVLRGTHAILRVGLCVCVRERETLRVGVWRGAHAIPLRSSVRASKTGGRDASTITPARNKPLTKINQQRAPPE